MNLSKKTFVSGCKVCGYLPWKHPSAFQPLQFCSSPSYKQKRFMWPCSKLFWLCLSCKQLLVSSTITAKLMSKFVFVPPSNNAYCHWTVYLAKLALRTTIPECLPEQLHYWCLNSLMLRQHLSRGKRSDDLKVNQVKFIGAITGMW